MYSSIDSSSAHPPSGLRRLARRDLPSTPRTPRPVAAAVVAPATWPSVTAELAFAWVRQGALWIAILAVVGAIAGYGFSVLAPPRYTAYSDIVVDPASLQVVSNDIYSPSFDQQGQLLDVESKLRVLTSGNVLTSVVTQLRLQDDPEFSTPEGLLSFLSMSELPTDPVLTALGVLEKRVTARREERSYVVTLSVSTNNPDKSVRIANAIVAAFQAELAMGEMDGATRSAAALMDRLSELKAGVTAAEDAVQKFRRANGLEQTAQGELVNMQSMSLLNQQLVGAQQALISAEARYRELTDPTTGALNANAIQSPTMVALRTQYGTMQQSVDASSALYGPLHPSRASGERQLAGLNAQIEAEANRYVQSIRLELDQARETVAQLQGQVASARDVVATDGEAQVELRALERDAKAKSDVYEAFLTRAREITERQQLDTTNIRVISPATPPGTRSWPPRGYIMAGAGSVGGLALGITLALVIGFLAAARVLRKKA